MSVMSLWGQNSGRWKLLRSVSWEFASNHNQQAHQQVASMVYSLMHTYARNINNRTYFYQQTLIFRIMWDIEYYKSHITTNLTRTVDKITHKKSYIMLCIWEIVCLNILCYINFWMVHDAFLEVFMVISLLMCVAKEMCKNNESTQLNWMVMLEWSEGFYASLILLLTFHLYSIL